MLTRIDHVGIAVADLDAAIAQYTATFGLRLVAIETNPEQGVREAMLALDTPRPDAALPAAHELAPHTLPRPDAALPAAHEPTPHALQASYVQLLEPLAADTPVGRFLARRGQGLHHVGYAVDDIDSALESLTAQGVQLVDRRPRHGSLGASIAFVHPHDLFGVLTELVQATRA